MPPVRRPAGIENHFAILHPGLETLVTEELLKVERAGELDMLRASSLCCTVFFGRPGFNIIRSIQLAQLRREQFADITARAARSRTTFYKVSSVAGELVAFAEVSLGSSIYPGRPVLSNLAVETSWRRRGLAMRLVNACEEEAVSWGFDEILLLVDSDNSGAIDLYKNAGYCAFLSNSSSQRYDMSGFLRRVVPVTRLVMRKNMTEIYDSSFLG